METNLVLLTQTFSGDDRKCRAYLEALRWPMGVKCPRCESAKISRIFDRHQFDCDSCRYQFSVTAGTIFNDTHLAIWKWFLAVYLMCESKKGISARQLGRSISVSYKTAWYLCHRIRKAMSELSPPKVGGPGKTVEMDETDIGGKRKKRGDTKVLHGFAAETTHPNTSKVYTDDNLGYNGVGDANTEHHSVNHSAEEWVRGDVQTNGIEGVWSLLKRSIVGSYHQVSAKHLDSYREEFEWRFNQRENPFLFRDTLCRLLTTQKMEYKELTA